MTIPKRIHSIIGVMLFMLGILFGLALSSGILWGETEARIYEVKPAEAGLKISCPFMLAPGESGMIRAVITERVTPTVRAEISHADVRWIKFWTLHSANPNPCSGCGYLRCNIQQVDSGQHPSISI